VASENNMASAITSEDGVNLMSNLIKCDQARLALAQCRDVDKVKDIRDRSDAMHLYAKQTNGSELERWAAKIKLRAQRAIGEISAGLEKKASASRLRSATWASHGSSSSPAAPPNMDAAASSGRHQRQAQHASGQRVCDQQAADGFHRVLIALQASAALRVKVYTMF
jgi:hypothetical protein